MQKQSVVKYEMKLLSSLAKVFHVETPVYQPECLVLSALWGETVPPIPGNNEINEFLEHGIADMWTLRNRVNREIGKYMWNLEEQEERG